MFRLLAGKIIVLIEICVYLLCAAYIWCYELDNGRYFPYPQYFLFTYFATAPEFWQSPLLSTSFPIHCFVIITANIRFCAFRVTDRIVK
jgi:hypothetical protein